MRESMLIEAIAMYEKFGDSAIDLITRANATYEHSRAIDELRKADRASERLRELIYRKYSKNPEEIYLKKEQDEYILHFVLWVKKMVKSYSEKDWSAFERFVVEGKKLREIAKEDNISIQEVKQKLMRARKRIKELVPLYNEQFGDIKDYLEL